MRARDFTYRSDPRDRTSDSIPPRRFHPEKNIFEWGEDLPSAHPHEAVAHDLAAVAVAQFFANFFGARSRRDRAEIEPRSSRDRARSHRDQPRPAPRSAEISRDHPSLAVNECRRSTHRYASGRAEWDALIYTHCADTSFAPGFIQVYKLS